MLSIIITNTSSDPLVAVTIFTIEILAHNRTLYKLCGRYNYTNTIRQPKEMASSMFVTDTENTMAADEQAEAKEDSDDLVVDVRCDGQDAVGHYIFIRDDRKKEDYFRICDVEVFQFDTRGQWWEIIAPLYSQINLTLERGQEKVSK